MDTRGDQQADGVDEPDAYLDELPAVDLSVEPAAMLAIRNDVRAQFVHQVHFHRIAARAYRKVGMRSLARKHEAEAEKTLLMIAALQDPMARPDEPQEEIELP